MHEILEKHVETRIDTHQLYVDFKSELGSTKGSCLYTNLSEFGSTLNYVALTLSNTQKPRQVREDLLRAVRYQTRLQTK